MMDDESLTVRLTVMVNNMNYNECVLPIENGAANCQQFKRAARQRTSQKYSGVSKPLVPSALLAPSAPAVLFTGSNVNY